MTGRVKFWNPAGYGFVQVPGEPDVFVSQSVLQECGLRMLGEGDLVEVAIEEGPKGLRATTVKVLRGVGRDELGPREMLAAMKDRAHQLQQERQRDIELGLPEQDPEEERRNKWRAE